MVRLLGIAVLVPVVVAGLGFAWLVYGQGSSDPHLATAAPTIPAGSVTSPTDTVTTPAATTAAASTAVSQPSPAATATATQGPKASTSFSVVTEQSNATLVVGEVIAGRDSSGVATGSGITGAVYLNDKGVDTTKKTSFKIDLRTLKSSDLLLSLGLGDTLQTDIYPYGEFSIESTSPFPPDYANGAEFAATIGGTLTLHGVSRQTQWTLKLRQSGAVLTGIADTDIKMTDYGIQPPNAGLAHAKDGVHLQIVFVAHQTQ